MLQKTAYIRLKFLQSQFYILTTFQERIMHYGTFKNNILQMPHLTTSVDEEDTFLYQDKYDVNQHIYYNIQLNDLNYMLLAISICFWK